MPAILWALLIAYMLFSPGEGLPRFRFLQLIPHFDKIVHLILFGILTLLLIFGFQQQQVFKSRRYYPALIAMLVATLYGGLTELIQHLLPFGRTADLLDFIADFAGISGCFLLSLLWNGVVSKS